MGLPSDAQPGPAPEHGRRGHPIDHDDLRPAAGARDEPDVTTGHTELVREQAQERMVRGSAHGGSGHVGPELSVDHAVDAV